MKSSFKSYLLIHSFHADQILALIKEKGLFNIQRVICLPSFTSINQENVELCKGCVVMLRKLELMQVDLQTTASIHLFKKDCSIMEQWEIFSVSTSMVLFRPY